MRRLPLAWEIGDVDGFVGLASDRQKAINTQARVLVPFSGGVYLLGFS